jgi:hypothetical protein
MKLMKILILLILSLASLPLWAEDCTRYQAKIDKLEQNIHHGGSAKRVNSWRKSLHLNEEKLSECKRTSAERIYVYSGKKTKTKYSPEKLYRSKNSDPQLQKLIATCNFWIAEHNRKQSPENRAFKDNACRDARTMESELDSPYERTTFTQVRSTKECIKDNNVIDNEVRACMEGQLIPYWKQ